MRLLVISVFVGMTLGNSTLKNVAMNANLLDGTWIPVQQVLDGNALPSSLYEKYRLVIADSIYSYGTAKTDLGVLTYHDGKMDIYGREGVNAGKHFTAIYKIENDQLAICYNLAGDVYPDGYETKDKPAYFLSVFKRETAK